MDPSKNWTDLGAGLWCLDDRSPDRSGPLVRREEAGFVVYEDAEASESGKRLSVHSTLEEAKRAAEAVY